MGNNVSYQNATWGTPSPGIAVKTTEVAGVHTQHVNVDNTVTAADAYAQLGGDAGGRKRVSQITTLGDYKTLGQDRTLLFDNQGTGAGAWGGNLYTMSVTAGQWRVRQSKQYHPYFSGKSQIIEATFDNFHAEANVTKRVGYFSSNAGSPFDATYDGFWLENDGTTISLKATRAGTETLSVALASWSGYANLAEYQTVSTWQNFTVVLFDFLWLGGAVLRVWVRTAAGFVLAHIFNYPGTAQNVFILSPNQPLRYEIRSTTGSGTFRYICAQVATEGAINESGLSRSVRTAHTGVACTTAGTSYPLLAVRKNATYRDTAVQLITQQVFVTSAADQIIWELQLNPTLSAGLTYGSVVNSAIQSASGNGTITVTSPGTVLATGMLSQNTLVPNGALVQNFLAFLGSTLANAMDEIVLVGTGITAGVTTVCEITVKEF